MFGTKKKRVYLDFAAAAPISPAARSVFTRAIDAYGNPSSPHEEGRQAKAILEDARTRIARLAQVKTDGVVFTSGATEANALAILGFVRARGIRGAHVLYHPSQHASVIGAIDILKAEGAEVEEIDILNFAKQIRSGTALITLDVVNSETGEIFDTLSIRRALDAAKSKALLHADASQAPYARPFTLASLGADMLTLDAQKIGGVRGIGVLLVRQGIKLEPLMRGGEQEGGRRSGTQSPALASAFATALEEAKVKLDTFVARATKSRGELIRRISAIPNLIVNEGKSNVPHILNLSLVGRDTDYVVALLDKAGFAVSTKSACESDSETGSRAVFAMTSDEARAASTLRISWGHTTQERDLEQFADALVRTVRFLDENAI